MFNNKYADCFQFKTDQTYPKTYQIRHIFITDMHGQKLMVNSSEIYWCFQIFFQPLVLDDGLNQEKLEEIVKPLS